MTHAELGVCPRGTDDTGCVTVEIDSRGDVTSLTVSNGWERRVRWTALGDAVLLALARATRAAWATREDGASLTGMSRPGPDSLADSLAESPAESHREPDSAALSDALSISRWETYRAARDAYANYRRDLTDTAAASWTLSSSDGIVTATVSAGELVRLDYEEYRVKFADAADISASTHQLINRAEADIVDRLARVGRQNTAIATWRTARAESVDAPSPATGGPHHPYPSGESWPT